MNELSEIKRLCGLRNIQLTEHALKRALERNIDIEKDIIPAILSGEIIEEYPNDYPYKSYLILGVTLSQVYLHVVCAIGEDVLWIITEYFPDINAWEKDFKTRKEQ